MGHLEIVTENFNASKYRERMIRNELRVKNFASSLARRMERIEKLRGRKGVVEFAFDPRTRLIYRRVYLDGALVHQIASPPANKGQLRDCIDVTARTIVPWRAIESGVVWREEVPLSPYYLDEILPVENLIRVDFTKRQLRPRSQN